MAGKSMETFQMKQVTRQLPPSRSGSVVCVVLGLGQRVFRNTLVSETMAR